MQSSDDHPAVAFSALLQYRLQQFIQVSLTCGGFPSERASHIRKAFTCHEIKITCWSRWRHQMETFSALPAFCAGNSPATDEFPSQRPVTQSFGVFFDLCLNKQLSKQSRRWWFETPSCPLWRHCNGSCNHSCKPIKPDWWKARPSDRNVCFQILWAVWNTHLNYWDVNKVVDILSQYKDVVLPVYRFPLNRWYCLKTVLSL